MAANDDEQRAEASAARQIAPVADATEPLNNHEGAEAEAAPGKRATVVVKQVEESESEGEEKDDEIDDSIVEMKDWLGEIPEDQEDLELVHLKLQSSHIAQIDLPRLAKQLKRLCLRQNQITTVDRNIFGKLPNLEELDFYDNKIKDIDDGLDDNVNLTELDLSFNLLKHIPVNIKNLTLLHTIYFVQNRISKIDGLDNLGAKLRSLELGGNRLRKIEGLDALVNLEELWLGKNKIGRLEGLDNLRSLKILSIQSNRITKLEGLDKLSTLEEFYISHNGIKQIEGLEHNLNIRMLDVTSNFITVVENISHLSILEEFWASGNKISDLRQVESQLAHIKTLETVYLEGNPIQLDDRAGYRRKVMLALPQLKQIDATFVRPGP